MSIPLSEMNNNQDLSIVKRMKMLYSSSKWHDIEFHLNSSQTGEVTVIGAHRLVLATCSPMFEALCYGPLAAKKPVIVPDIDPDAFQVMLKFLYTNTLNLKSVETVCSLYYAAKKYLLPSLCKLTCDYLIENINETNCLELHDMALFFQEDALMRETWYYICSHLKYISKFVSCEQLSNGLLEKLVNAPMLDADEIVLVQLSIMWAKSTCRSMRVETNGQNVRNILTQCLIFQGIRWNLLGKEDILSMLPGILTEEEIHVLCNPDNSKATNIVPREKPPVKMFFIHRFLEKEKFTLAPREGMTVSTVITPNRSGILHGIFVCCTRSLCSMFQPESVTRYVERMVISILDSDGNLLSNEQQVKKEVISGEPFVVNLFEPLPMTSGSPYDIRVHLLNSAHTYEFRARNACAKVPSGISVTFKESADVYESGIFFPAPNFSLISGLKMSW